MNSPCEVSFANPSGSLTSSYSTRSPEVSLAAPPATLMRTVLESLRVQKRTRDSRKSPLRGLWTRPPPLKISRRESLRPFDRFAVFLLSTRHSVVSRFQSLSE